jgi:hypothetical protein
VAGEHLHVRRRENPNGALAKSRRARVRIRRPGSSAPTAAGACGQQDHPCGQPSQPSCPHLAPLLPALPECRQST